MDDMSLTNVSRRGDNHRTRDSSWDAVPRPTVPSLRCFFFVSPGYTFGTHRPRTVNNQEKRSERNIPGRIVTSPENRPQNRCHCHGQINRRCLWHRAVKKVQFVRNFFSCRVMLQYVERVAPVWLGWGKKKTPGWRKREEISHFSRSPTLTMAQRSLPLHITLN